MNSKTLTAAAAALTLTALPVAVQAAEAQRASKPAAATSNLADSNMYFIVLALAAIAAGIFLLADEDDTAPTSP